MNTPTNNIPYMMVPINKAISPPLKYYGNVVTSRCTIAVADSTATETWNIKEFSQVLPSFMGWSLKNGIASLTKKMPFRVASTI